MSTEPLPQRREWGRETQRCLPQAGQRNGAEKSTFFIATSDPHHGQRGEPLVLITHSHRAGLVLPLLAMRKSLSGNVAKPATLDPMKSRANL